MKNKKQPKAAQAKPKVKVKDIAPKKNPTGGAISKSGDLSGGTTGGALA